MAERVLGRLAGAAAVAAVVVWVTAAGLLRPFELPLTDRWQRALPQRLPTRLAAVLSDEPA